MPPDEALLVVVDQFEELFRYKDVQPTGQQARRRHDVAAAEAAEFVQLLIAASRHQPPVYIILTMRSDYLGDCAEFRDLPETLNDCQYLVPRLTREQRKEVIEGPLGRVKIAPNLVQRLLNDAGDQPDQLPILQHALMRTWAHWHSSDPEEKRRIEIEDYLSIGGFENAINQHADEVLAGVPENLAKIIFKRLTARGRGNRERRDPATLAELWEVCEVETPEARERVTAVIDRFRLGSATFLTPRVGAILPETYIDITHESLLRQWRKLRDEWLPAEQRSAKTFLELTERARNWEAGKAEALSGLDLKDALEWNRLRNRATGWAEHYAEAADLQRVLRFIEASEKNERTQLLRKRGLLVAAPLATVFAVLSIFALWKAYEASNLASVAHASQLAANAGLALPIDASLAVLLARQAVKEGGSNDTVALQALRDAIAKHVPSIEAKGLTAASSRGYIPGANKSSWLDFSLSAASISSQGDLAIAPSGGNAVIWSTGSGEMKTLPHAGIIVGSASFSPDGRLAVSTGADGLVKLWDVSTGQLLKSLEHREAVNNAVFSRDGALLVTLGDDGKAQLWNVKDLSASPRCVLEDAGSNFVFASFSSDQRLLVTTTHFAGWQAQVWDLNRVWDEGLTSNTRCPQVTVPALANMANLKSASFSEVGAWLGVVTVDGQTIVFDAADWARGPWRYAPVVRYETEDDEAPVDQYPPRLAWSHKTERRYAFAGGDYTVYVMDFAEDLKPGPRPIGLRGHTGGITSMAFSPIDDTLMTTSADGTARIWTLTANGRVLERLVLTGHKDMVGSGAFSPKGDTIITASDDGAVRSWTPHFSLQEQQFQGLDAAWYSTDGKQISVSGSDVGSQSRPVEGFWVSDVTTAELAAVGDKRSISTPDERRSFHGPTVFERSQSGGGIRVRDLRRPDSVRLLAESNDLALGDLVGLSPRERFVLATGTTTDAARVWDLDAQGGPDEVDLPSTSEYESCEAQSISDNKGIAWYCTNRDVVLVTHSGEAQPVVISIADGKRVELLQFGVNGLLLALTLEDFSVRVFDSRTGQPLQTMKGHHGRIGNITFSRDDDVLLSVSDDSTARMWDIKSGKVMAETNVPPFTRFTRAVASSNGLSAFFLADDRLLLWRCYACGDAEELQKEVEARKIDRILSTEEMDRYGLTP